MFLKGILILYISLIKIISKKKIIRTDYFLTFKDIFVYLINSF